MRLQDENKKKAIIESSVNLINSLGLAGVSMSKIAKEANVSPATIYTYFENKEQLINELYYTFKHEMIQSVKKEFKIDLPIKEGIKKLWYCSLNYIKNNEDHFKFLEQYSNSPIIAPEIQEKVYSEFEPLIKFIQKGVDEKVLRNESVMLLIVFLFQPLSHLLKGCFKGEMKIDDNILNSAFEMTWNSIKRTD